VGDLDASDHDRESVDVDCVDGSTFPEICVDQEIGSNRRRISSLNSSVGNRPQSRDKTLSQRPQQATEKQRPSGEFAHRSSAPQWKASFVEAFIFTPRPSVGQKLRAGHPLVEIIPADDQRTRRRLGGITREYKILQANSQPWCKLPELPIRQPVAAAAISDPPALEVLVKPRSEKTEILPGILPGVLMRHTSRPCRHRWRGGRRQQKHPARGLHASILPPDEEDEIEEMLALAHQRRDADAAAEFWLTLIWFWEARDAL
jgi:hypothetical protein